MTKELLLFEPVFKERIWGGDALKKHFNYDIPSSHTGECWAISAHPHGESVVRQGRFKGYSLSELWTKHRELFGNIPGDQFPILTKILDAKTNLSVQVHPDDDYANKNEKGAYGKTECWYVIDCKKDAELILGHHANSKEEMISMIENNEWDLFLRKISIHPGDFIFVPSGTVHAICEGTLILETQQSSDVTYRLYDYDRKDTNRQVRELHIEKSMDVINVPYKDTPLHSVILNLENLQIKTFIETEYFSVQEWRLSGVSTIKYPDLPLIVSVLEGKATINETEVNKGDHFIIPSDYGEIFLQGHAKFIVSFI